MSTKEEEDPFAELREDAGNPMWQLFVEYGRGERLQFAVGAVASVISRGMNLLPPLVIGVAIDALFFDRRPFSLPFLPTAWVPAEPWGQFWLSAGILAAAFLLGSGLNWVNSWAWNHFAQHLQHAVRTDTYDAMQRLEMEFFDDKQTGEVMSILNNDVNQLENFLTGNLNTAIRIAVMVGGVGLIMFLLDPALAVISFVAVPVLGAASYRFVKHIHPKYKVVRSSVGALNSRLENNLGGIEVIKSYNREPFESTRVEDASRDYLDANWAAITTRITFFPTMQLITGLGFLATFVVGGMWLLFPERMPVATALTPGMLVTFLMYSQRFMWPMQQLGQIINSYQYARAASERIFGLMDEPRTVPERSDPIDLGAVEGRVEYDNVSFRYEGGGELVLDSVSFVTEAGETVGLVGPTGSGKTTLLKLLLRMYDVSDGAIRVDGRDVRDVALTSLRDAVGYVSQEAFLFYGTIAENIAYGRLDADPVEIEEAARLAGAHEFIAELSEGYDTMVGERGVKLSGGQRQRISIARAILKDPEILVLDEATSHVDNETELLIQRSLERLTADRTTFVIAHRLSTVRSADAILVLEDGEVVERGTHDDLLAEDGLYANLWGVQVGEIESLPMSFVERTIARDRTGATD